MILNKYLIGGVAVSGILLSIWLAGSSSGKKSEKRKEEVKTAIIVNEEVEKVNETEKIKTNIDKLKSLDVCKRLHPKQHKACERQFSPNRGMEGMEDQSNGSSRYSTSSTEEQLFKEDMAEWNYYTRMPELTTVGHDGLYYIRTTPEEGDCSDCVDSFFLNPDILDAANDVLSWDGEM